MFRTQRTCTIGQAAAELGVTPVWLRFGVSGLRLCLLHAVIRAAGVTTCPMISSGSDVSELENVRASLRLVMSSLRITYATRQDATPEGELNALAAVYAFVLARTKAAERTPEPDSRDDHESLVNERRSLT